LIPPSSSQPDPSINKGERVSNLVGDRHGVESSKCHKTFATLALAQVNTLGTLSIAVECKEIVGRLVRIDIHGHNWTARKGNARCGVGNWVVFHGAVCGSRAHVLSLWFRPPKGDASAKVGRTDSFLEQVSESPTVMLCTYLETSDTCATCY
jgi:hypothetical protein